MIDIDNNITFEKAKEIYHDILILIRKYDEEYYVKNSPSITDAEYDQLCLILQNLEKKYPILLSKESPTNIVSGKAESKFKKVTHFIPMLSLSNIFSNDDLSGFIKKVQNYLKYDEWIDIFVELKIDGVSFSARYEQGELKYASTRGDGYIGEDITNNIKTIKNFPLKINNVPDIFEVRGEIFIYKDDFNLFNENQKIEAKQIFANARNAASGSIRQLDSSISAERPLNYFVYSLGYVSEKIFTFQSDIIDFFKKIGFSVNLNNKLCKSKQEIIDFYEKISKKRDEINFEIDGVVLKINDLSIQDRLGFIGKTPRWATAYKFPAFIGSTKLNNIIVQVGRTGALTPVAELLPINIGGVNVSRATLHNFHEILRLGIKIGDYVYLERAGDVIPKINSVDISKRPPDSEDVIIPSKCPSCNSDVFFEEDEAILRCENGLKCPAQRKERLIYFVSKNSMNIEGLGKKQIEFLLEKSYITGPVDIFNLKNSSIIENLKNEEGWGELSVNNLLKSIENSKNITLDKFIHSLGIRHIGSNNAKILASYFMSIENLIDSINQIENMNEELYNKLSSIDGFGNKVIFAIKDFFSAKENANLIKELSLVLNIKNYQNRSNISSSLFGKIIVFTGSLKKISRSEAKDIAEKLGAKVGSSVSKNTDYVVAGLDAGSKLKKANELGIKIISEEEWIQMFEVSE